MRFEDLPIDAAASLAKMVNRRFDKDGQNAVEKWKDVA
jgi:hypothetical protein